MPSIALIEDDSRIRVTLEIGLKSKGIEVHTYSSAEEFLENQHCFNRYDLYLVDLGLPQMSGEGLCKKIKTEALEKPLIVITARIGEETAVAAFAMGAEDFVRKPFGLEELFARIQRVLNRSSGVRKTLRFEELTLRSHERMLYFKDKNTSLTLRECEILTLLFQSSDQVISRERILNRIDGDGSISDRTLDSHISNIRKKIIQLGVKEVSISSVYGTGYRIERKR